MQEKFRRLKAEMEEICEEQKNIREGQRQVREKFQVIESECEDLKRETKLIIKKTARTQIKLALMFRIFKASQQGDLATVANLTHLLRYFSFLNLLLSMFVYALIWLRFNLASLWLLLVAFFFFLLSNESNTAFWMQNKILINFRKLKF